MKLLTPILVDALVVDDVLNEKEAQAWARNADDYKNTLRFESPNINVLERSDAAKTGIHIQWILPHDLCHGEQKENDTIEFPKVPNRWLVSRMYLDTSSSIQVKSWIVLSDFINDSPTNNANYLYEKNGVLTPAKLGKVVALEDFQEVDTSNELFLTAMSNGNIAFSSYTPDNENVFSFVDELSDFENKEQKFTYFVCGWYSNPDEIPTNYFDAFNDSNLNNVLFHGAIYGVNWFGKAGDFHKSRSGKPDNVGDIIIANSSFDAIVRLLQKVLREEADTEEKLQIAEQKTQQIAQLLTAFEHRLLDKLNQPGGFSELDKATHDAWFTAENGGIIWTIQNQSPNETLEDSLKDSKAIHLLNQLNEVFIKLQELEQLKVTLQTELYTTWVRLQRNNQNTDLKNQFDTLLSDVHNSEKEATFSKKEEEKILNELNNLLNSEFNDTLVLKQKMQPKYWEANEPIILIHAAKASDKYAFDKELKHRFSNEIITELKEYYSQQSIESAAPTLSNLDSIPTEIQDLIKETILLNPDFSAYLYQQTTNADKATPETLEKQQTLIWNNEIYPQLDSDKLTELAGYVGKRPSLRAFSKHLPTWSPLFLDWEVDYHPNSDDNNTIGWVFKDFGFELDENNIGFSGNNKITLSGRSLLSTQASKILERKLLDFEKTLQDEAEKEVIGEVIRIISKFDIVTQQLSGFNEMLTGLDINNIIPIPNKNEVLKTATNGGKLGLPIDIGKQFFVRSGFLHPKTIRITDDFGLAIYPLDRENNKQPLVLKGKGCDHKAVGKRNITMLPPRIIQPARITMNGLGINTGKSIIVANEDNPIIGWVMTDFLDKSLEVFDTFGDHIGELLTAKRGDKADVRWLPNDGKTIINQNLAQFRDGILNYENNASALSALMQSIDDSLILNTSKYANADAFSLLIGQPLALVQVRIDLAVKGKADERLKEIEFQIQIGEQALSNNGVVGYFKGGDFSQLFVLNDKDQSDYLKQATTETIKVGTPLNLTLLMNPDGVAHLVSGILPVFEFTLSTKLITKPIDNMNVSFRVGPTIQPDDKIQLSKPQNSSKKLVWQQSNKPENDTIETVTQGANFSKNRNVLREGWLKIKDK